MYKVMWSWTSDKSRVGKKCQYLQLMFFTGLIPLFRSILNTIPCSIPSFHFRVTSHQSCPKRTYKKMSGMDFTINTKYTLVYWSLASEWFFSDTSHLIEIARIGTLWITLIKLLELKSFWKLEIDYISFGRTVLLIKYQF